MSSNDDDVSGGSARADRVRREKIRARHERAAADGIHLPSVRELIQGMSWLSRDIFHDAKTWAERTMTRIDQATALGAEVFAATAALTSDPRLHDFLVAAEASRRAMADGRHDGFGPRRSRYDGPDAESAAVRLDFYAAALGDQESCIRIARHAVWLADDSHAPSDVSGQFASAALGWLAIARTACPYPIEGERSRPGARDDLRQFAEVQGEILAREIAEHRTAIEADAAPVGDGTAAKKRTIQFRGRGTMAGAKVLDIDCDLHEILDGADDEPTGGGVVVIKEIGMPDTSEGKRVVEVFKHMTGKLIPLRSADDPEIVRRILLSEFPHAGDVIAAVLRDAESGKPVKFRPTLLVGDPGCGKTSFARALLTRLDLVPEIYNCGGVADASVAGNARKWSSGEPSLPVALVRRHSIANPAIILDEIEKAGNSRHNGCILDALLGMLEPASASCWHDPYIQAAVDLSHVVWLATANSIDGIPAVLRDRMRIIRFPSPTAAHLPVLANQLLRQAVIQRGLPDAWCLPLDGVELEMLAECWAGGSIRRLGRLVEGVLAARDQSPAAN